MAGEATVGSILGYLRLDRSDWDSELRAAGQKADELGRHNPNIRIGTNAPSAIAQLSAVAAATKRLQDAQGAEAVAEARLQSLRDRGVQDAGRLAAAEEAVAKARRGQAAAVVALAAAQDTEHAAASRVVTDTDQAAKKADAATASFRVGLIPALLSVAPAAVPIAAVAGGALIGLLPVAATVALAVKGIEAQMKSAAGGSGQFAQSVTTLKGDLSTLEGSAAAGLMSGINKALSQSQGLFGQVNGLVQVMGVQLGDIVAGAAPALLRILTELNPLFITFSDLLTRGASELEHWANSSTGVQSFVAYVQSVLPQVMSFLGNVIVLFSHLAQAAAPFGGALLADLNLFVGALNSIPIGVLQTAIPLVTALYLALKTYGGITAIVKGVNQATTALGKAWAALDQPMITAAAQARLAALQTEAAAKQEALAVAEAKVTEAEAAAQSAEDQAVAAEQAGEADSALTRIIADNAAEQVAAFRAAAAAAAASAEEISAEAAAAAEASTTAGEAASIGWGSMLGPIGAVVAGGGLLATMFLHSGRAAAQMQQEVNGLTDAIKQDSGAIGENTKAYVVNALQKSGALAAARTLGLNLQDVTSAALGNKAAMDLITSATTQYSYGVVGSTKDTSKQVAASKTLLGALGDQNSAVGQAKTAYDNEQAAMGKATAAANTQTAAAAQLADAINKANSALQGFYDTELSNAQTQDQFLIGLKQIGSQIKTNGTSLSEHTLKGLQNRDMLISNLQAAENAAKGSKDYTGALENNVKQFEQSAINAGFSRSAVQKLIAQMHLTPKDIETRFNADITPAQRALIALNNYIKTHTPHVTVEVSASGAKGEYIPGVGYVIQHKAAGGEITGAGPKGVDSVPLLGAPGEFVMSNRAVDKYGLGFMRALNAGTLTLPTVPVASSTGRATRDGVVINNFITAQPDQSTREVGRAAGDEIAWALR